MDTKGLNGVFFYVGGGNEDLKLHDSVEGHLKVMDLKLYNLLLLSVSSWGESFGILILIVMGIEGKW